MSEKMREALLRAVAMVESDVIQVRPSERDDLMQWLTQANAALAEQPAQGAHSPFANSENSVETHAGSRQSAQGEAVELFDSAVAAELPRVSHAEYDSHEVCKFFASKLRERIAKPTAPPAPSVPDDAMVLRAVNAMWEVQPQSIDWHNKACDAMRKVLTAAFSTSPEVPRG